jgi:Sec-independent protein secretion pathway component TatC
MLFSAMNCRLVFSYEILTPAALNFFVSYAEGAVESLWSIDQYFQFVLVLMLSTGLSFQVCDMPVQSLCPFIMWGMNSLLS